MHFRMALCCGVGSFEGSTRIFQDAKRTSVGGNAPTAWLCMCADASGVDGTGWQCSCLGSGAGLASAAPACAVMSKLSWCPSCPGLPTGVEAGVSATDVALRSASSCKTARSTSGLLRDEVAALLSRLWNHAGERWPSVHCIVGGGVPAAQACQLNSLLMLHFAWPHPAE